MVKRLRVDQVLLDYLGEPIPQQNQAAQPQTVGTVLVYLAENSQIIPALDPVKQTALHLAAIKVGDELRRQKAATNGKTPEAWVNLTQAEYDALKAAADNPKGRTADGKELPLFGQFSLVKAMQDAVNGAPSLTEPELERGE